MERALILLAVVLVAVAASALWRRLDGRTTTPVGAAGEGADLLAHVHGDRSAATPWTFVEFTAPDCVPCRATAAVLEEVAADRSDVTVAAVDVAEGLELARAHGVLRAPTTFLVDAEGTIVSRTGGVPVAENLRTLLGDVAGSRAA